MTMEIDDWACQQVGYHRIASRHTEEECSMTKQSSPAFTSSFVTTCEQLDNGVLTETTALRKFVRDATIVIDCFSGYAPYSLVTADLVRKLNLAEGYLQARKER